MATEMLRTVTSLLSKCSHRMSRAARKLRMQQLTWRTPIRRRAATVFLGGDRRKKIGEELGAEEEVWRRGIIMGEKCQLLDFSGVIYYDSDGRQLAEVPTSRSSMRSPLPAYLVDEKTWI